MMAYGTAMKLRRSCWVTAWTRPVRSVSRALCGAVWLRRLFLAALLSRAPPVRSGSSAAAPASRRSDSARRSTRRARPIHPDPLSPRASILATRPSNEDGGGVLLRRSRRRLCASHCSNMSGVLRLKSPDMLEQWAAAGLPGSPPRDVCSVRRPGQPPCPERQDVCWEGRAWASLGAQGLGNVVAGCGMYGCCEAPKEDPAGRSR